jgi:hypothetical protein
MDVIHSNDTGGEGSREGIVMELQDAQLTAGAQGRAGTGEAVVADEQVA